MSEETILPPPKTKELASVFDNLIGATLKLTVSVERLVRLSWAIVILNVLLITVVAALLAWVAFTVRQPARALLDVGHEDLAYSALRHP